MGKPARLRSWCSVRGADSVEGAAADFLRPGWILANMDRYGVPRSWLPWLGSAKTVGAVGLLVGCDHLWLW
ncbi:DoxX family protein [Nocardia huaxiensis]|uniref:DoxX family protein n=1 Tax=Nocardia huaxiensis TaxID=2755382 RepID=UPI001C665F6D